MSILFALNDWKTSIEIAESIAKIAAISVAGWWAYRRFIRQRENHPIIDFSADMVFHTFKDGYWVVELVAAIENKGKVQHKLKDLSFELCSIDSEDNIELSAEFSDQYFFQMFLRKEVFYRSVLLTSLTNRE
jgi:hypothetical protein